MSHRFTVGALTASALLALSGLAFAGPAHADTIDQENWSCSVPAYSASQCGPTIDVPDGDILYASVDSSSADSVHFTAYTGATQGQSLGDCSTDPGGKCKVWVNTSGDTITVSLTVHDNGWSGHDETGSYEVDDS